MPRRGLIEPRRAGAPTGEEIAAAFNTTFAATFATVMISGATEPLYLPSEGAYPARIFFRSDFAASALHEAAHWCIAGLKRRGLVDYGYRYAPPPRAVHERRAFFDAELNVQALERAFSETVGLPFRISADDFAATELERTAFESAVTQRCIERRATDLPPRAACFLAALERAGRRCDRP